MIKDFKEKERLTSNTGGKQVVYMNLVAAYTKQRSWVEDYLILQKSVDCYI